MSSNSDTDVLENSNDRSDGFVDSVPSTTSQSGASTPLPSVGRGRQVIRQRYIHQKRMACLDEKALNEVRIILES
jgi:hypothetical protein